MLTPILAAPLSFLYGLGVDIRNKLFDLNILKSHEFDIPIVCVGNLTVGGTGKTPVTEYLVEELSREYRVAVLSLGYKRKTKGFQLATDSSSFRTVGDEPKQIKLKFPAIPVAVCEKRVEGIKKIRKHHPEVNLIILDDAYQHRYVEPWVNIVLMDYNRPIYQDKLMPWGWLRDRASRLDRAHFVLVTKCPDDLNPLDIRLVRNSLGLFPYQSLYFSQMKQEGVIPLFPDVAEQESLKKHNPIVVMTGIANPSFFVKSLAQDYKIEDRMLFEDHYTYRVSDMQRLLELLKVLPPETVVVTTEKDAVKLINRKKIPLEIQRKLYFVPIRVSLIEDSEVDFLRQLKQYVETNQKYSVLHPE